MTQEKAGDYYALSCAIVCALGNTTGKVCLVHFTPELFQLYMFGFGLLMSSAYLVKPSARKEVFQTSRKALGLIFFLSILFSFGIYTFISSLKLIEPATVAFLSRFEVLIVLLLAFLFLKERLRFLELIGGLIAIGGIFVLKYKTTMVISQAATLMILSAFFFAAAEIIIKKNIELVGTIRFIFWRNLFAVGIFYIILVYHRQEIVFYDWKIMSLTAATAFFLPIMGRLTYIEALRRIKISRAALITQSLPLFTALFALIFLDSIPTPIEWLGGALIIIGVIIIKMTGKFQKNVQYKC